VKKEEAVKKPIKKEKPAVKAKTKAKKIKIKKT
jgi:hypothetical protein